MPKTQRNPEKAEVAKDWVRFKFSRYLWGKFLQKCVDTGKDVDEIISQLIDGWCLVINEESTEPGIQDKDQLENEFALLFEDLNRCTLHYEKRDQLVHRAMEIRKKLHSPS